MNVSRVPVRAGQWGTRETSPPLIKPASTSDWLARCVRVVLV